MDNFMDKLAQKFSAQDIIKANSQAEASEMQKLQEQVAQYEAILQDMRKLNYKNAELTDKIYALVDESIGKVQELQKDEDGNKDMAANITANLSDAVMLAVDDALSNLDHTVGSALSDSVNGALMVPVGEMKQSTQEFNGTILAVRSAADDVKTSAEEIKFASEQFNTSAEQVNAAVEDVKNSVEDVRFSTTEVKQSVDSVKETISNVILTTEEMKMSTEEIKSTTQDLKLSTEDMKNSVRTSVDNALLTIKRENREIAEYLENIRNTIEDKKSNKEDLQQKEEEERVRKQEELEKEEQRKAQEEEDRKQLVEMFKQADDFVHKENVKVYRNVQAVVLDEFKSQTEGLTKHNRELYAKIKNTKTMVILSLVVGIANMVLLLLQLFHIL